MPELAPGQRVWIAGSSPAMTKAGPIQSLTNP